MKLQTLCAMALTSLAMHCAQNQPLYTFCIDGGGTKTILQVIDQQGNVLPLIKNSAESDSVITSGSNFNSVGLDGMKKVFQALIDDTRIKIHGVEQPLSTIIPQAQVLSGFGGITRHEEDTQKLLEQKGFNAEQIKILEDASLALELVDRDGAILISGTGSICLGKKDNRPQRVGGFGRILGDQGSGYHIGLQALTAGVIEEMEHRNPTSLTPALRTYYKNESLWAINLQLLAGKLSTKDVAGSTPLVFEHAQNGDQVAQGIVDLAAHDLGNHIVTLAAVSKLSDCQIHCWGGIFKNKTADSFIKKISDRPEIKENNITLVNQAHQNVALLAARKALKKDN